ncbi:DUF6311 domain-containing protein [Flavitalea sp.]|nr:DUF6311 domain-containing protein [Flavitalea sp.]
MENSRNKIALWVATTISVVLIYHTCYDLRSLWPPNVSWLMEARHDWGTHYLGWLFFKNEPWQFPLGQVTDYFYPIGTNVGFTDSIPLFALFFKLFRSVLPPDFQYFGIWLLLCHLLTAYASILLLKRLKVNDLNTFLAVLFIAANPVLVYRGLHPALCAHWLIIASVYIYLTDPAKTRINKILLYQWMILAVSALVNPYLCFMVLGFSFITSLKLSFIDKASGKATFFIYQAISILSLLFLWYLVGMFTINSSPEFGVQGGYGLYSLNLNSLFNTWGWSSLINPLTIVSWHQYEAFMYPGIGVFFLLVFSGIYYSYASIRRKPGAVNSNRFVMFTRPSLLPLILLVLGYSLFAITNVISVNDKVLFTLPIPRFMKSLGEIFRASARFFWLPYYLLLFLCFIWIDRTGFKKVTKAAILFVALIVQWLDTRPLLTSRHMTYGPYNVPISEKWKSMIARFNGVVFYPPFVASYVRSMDYQDFCFLAAKAGKPINTGYVARLDNKAMDRYRDSLNNALAAGELIPDKLYITDSAHLDRFSFALQNELAEVGLIDNYFYLFSKQKNNLNLANRLRLIDSTGYKIALKIIGEKVLFLQATFPNTLEKIKINFNIEHLTGNANAVFTDGWAFIDSTTNNSKDSIFLTLSNNDNSYVASAQRTKRPDLTNHFKKEFLDNAGFNSIIFKDSMAKGNYKLGIIIKDRRGNTYYQETGSKVRVGQDEPRLPLKVGNLPRESSIAYGLDTYKDDGDLLHLGGWAAFENQSYIQSVSSLVLKNEAGSYMVPVEAVIRRDVTESRSGRFDLDSCGFNVTVSKKLLPAGKYRLAIMIEDNREHKKGIIFINKSVISNSP